MDKALHPTLRLRWMVKANTVCREEILAYGEEHGMMLMEAKRILENRKPPVLQQYFESSDSAEMGEWRDVETAFEPSPIEK